MNRGLFMTVFYATVIVLFILSATFAVVDTTHNDSEVQSTEVIYEVPDDKPYNPPNYPPTNPENPPRPDYPNPRYG